MHVEPLSTSAVFLWGCGGGFFAALVTGTLPWLTEMFRDDVRPSLQKAIVGALLLVVHAVIGGFAATVVGTTIEIRQAVIHGVLWPVIWKSLGQTGKEILK